MPGASAELAAIAARLKVAGEKGLRTELLRGLKTGAAPLVPAVHDAAVAKLPHKGGLNEQVAGQKVTVQVRLGARTAGVRLNTTAPDTKQTDSGFVRHPVFDSSKSRARTSKLKWVTQQIPNAVGWWSQTLADKSPDVTPVLLAEMDRVANHIQRGV